MNRLALANQAAGWQRLKALVLDSVSSPIPRRVPEVELDCYAVQTGTCFACPALALPASAQFDKILRDLGGRSQQSDSKTASGLKEALQIGTGHAVNLTGTTDGFFKNQAIRILMPEKLRTVEKGLRIAGRGPKLDEFELSMNRAAGKATPPHAVLSRTP